jgi:SAM-dependent methyltransferase
MQDEKIRKAVREGYAEIARSKTSCCASKSCCGGPADVSETISKAIGYTDEELSSVPEGANLGLGCGNPVALASLKEGETVLDLGSGAGFDCFLAAKKVGAGGRVIGVDMTPEMLEKARENAERGGYSNIEFRLGEIENLPAGDNSIDAIISNCVINLAPDKNKVFREAHRVLKPGGRVMVSDIVLLKELPDFIRQSIAAYVGCISGALMKNDYLKAIRDAGFQQVEIQEESVFPVECMANDPTAKAVIKKAGLSVEEIESTVNAVASIRVSAAKPAAA